MSQSNLTSMMFWLRDVFGLEALQELGAFSDISDSVVEAILTEADKFTAEQLKPLNAIGDQKSSKLDNGKVVTPQGFKEAYQMMVANGWPALAFDKACGGQGLPYTIAACVSEFMNAANMAFTICPMLTQSGVELLSRFGSEEQKATYLQDLVQGKVTATMCLTEPQAGSDLGLVATKAQVESDGAYRVKGQKIFISYGGHDFTEQIVHLVLARTEGAPEGSKGLSLFLVPQILPDGSENDVKVLSLEHKLGIKASPTAVMEFGGDEGAIGYLIGEEHKGIIYMFTMMNHARIEVGLQGLGIAQEAYERALAYAKERVQMGRAIIEHGDVARTLDSMNAKIEAVRGLILYIAMQLDISMYHEDEAVRRQSDSVVALLTPIVKAYGSDQGFYVASDALQIFGGMGYIEETGIAQLLRDARIAMIYEGTNGIQAMDLISRKMPMDGLVDGFLDQVDTLCNATDKPQAIELLEISNFLRDISNRIKAAEKSKLGECAVPYLELFSYVACGYVMLQAQQKQPDYKPISDFFTYVMPLAHGQVSLLRRMVE